MRIFRMALIALLVTVAPVAESIAYAQFPKGPDTNGLCQPGINQAFQDHREAYLSVFNGMQPFVTVLTTQLRQVVNQATYQVLLTTSRTIANSIPNGRML